MCKRTITKISCHYFFHIIKNVYVCLLFILSYLYCNPICAPSNARFCSMIYTSPVTPLNQIRNVLPSYVIVFSFT